MDRRRDVGDRKERGGWREGKIRKNMVGGKQRENRNTKGKEVSGESRSDVQRQGWRNGGTKKNTQREEEKHGGGRNLEI